jgi:hypothetical protein
MTRYINPEKIIALQITTPADNPLVTDDSRLMDIWFAGTFIRHQLFKKVKKSEQEFLVELLKTRGFIQSGNLLIDPAAVVYAEMENQFLGGIITMGFQDSGKPVELKLSGKAFNELCARLAAHPAGGSAG